jgi:hypothetical protein
MHKCNCLFIILNCFIDLKYDIIQKQSSLSEQGIQMGIKAFREIRSKVRCRRSVENDLF